MWKQLRKETCRRSSEVYPEFFFAFDLIVLKQRNFKLILWNCGGKFPDFIRVKVKSFTTLKILSGLLRCGGVDNLLSVNSGDVKNIAVSSF